MKMEPHQIDAALRFGDVAKQDGNRQAAMKFYLRAAQAGSIPGTIQLAQAKWNDSPQESVAMLEAIKPTSAAEEVAVARTLVVHKGWLRRIQAGQMYDHAASAKDMGFDQSTTEWTRYIGAIAAYGPECVIDRACIAFHTGNRDTEAYSQFAGHVMGTVNWDHKLQTTPWEFDPLPLEHGVWLGCDQRYMPFAEPLVKSLKHHGAEPKLYVFDDHPKGALYYHAARFLRLAEWMEKHRRPVWLLDVDALCNGPPRDRLFPLLDGHDIALRGRPCRLEPWNQLNASVVGFNCTPNGKAYLRAVADYIQRAVDTDGLQWGIDQVALLCAGFGGEHLRIRWLDDKAVDYEQQDDSAIWCNSGRAKWRHLQTGCVDPDRAKYLAKFLEWSK